MNDRATFGDLAQQAVRHLEAINRSGVDGTGVIALTAEVQEFAAGLDRLLPVLDRYLADIAKSASVHDGTKLGPWERAALSAPAALRSARRHLPRPVPTRTWSSVQRTASVTREMGNAGRAMTAGRDLLHMHFTTTPGGIREPHSEWARIIESPRVNRALLAEVARWVRPLADRGIQLTTAAARQRGQLPDDLRAVMTACRCLTLLTTSVDKAHAAEPLLGYDVRELHAIPVSVLRPRRVPERGATTAGLCQGVADCAERIRRHAETEPENPAWSQTLTSESLSQSAASATTVSQHTAAILRALAGQAAVKDMVRLSQKMTAAAQAAERSEQDWLAAARGWYYTHIDAKAKISATAAETADLALWTGRLAHANPAWTPGSGSGHPARPLGEQPAEPEDLPQTVNALLKATAAITTIAATDYIQLRGAAQHGRLLVPVVRRGPSQRGTKGFDRAPIEHAESVLANYRSAGTASAQLNAALMGLAAELQPRRQLKASARSAARTAATVTGLHRDGTVPSENVGQPEKKADRPAMKDEAPGPIERILTELGVTDADVLNHGTALDADIGRVVGQAAHDTAPNRWNHAMRELKSVADTDFIVEHVLAGRGFPGAPQEPRPRGLAPLAPEQPQMEAGK
jgi:hypothetical protein